MNIQDQKKIIYDGKRIQPIYERKTIDYISGIFLESCIDQHFLIIQRHHTQKILIYRVKLFICPVQTQKQNIKDILLNLYRCVLIRLEVQLQQ